LKRRLLFLFGSFAVLLLAFAIYRYVTGRSIPADLEGPEPQLTPADVAALQRPEQRTGRELYAENRDEQGRLRGIYRAARSQKQPDGSYLLTKPVIEIYQKDGRGTFIRAERGVVYAAQSARGLDVQRAELRGDVSIVFELPRQPDQPATEKPDVIRIYVDDIEYDQELLTLYTDGPVRVFSSMIDIVGEGVTVSWNEEPNELRVLRIERGQYMAVYGVPAGMQIAMAGTATGPAANGGAVKLADTQPSAGSVAATQPAGPATVPASGPTLVPVDVEPIVLPTSRPVHSKPRNVYRARFEGSRRLINVDFGDSSIRGISQLALRFEWERSKMPRPERPAGRTGSSAGPATAPAGRVSPVSGATTTMAAATASSSPSSAPASAPARQFAEPDRKTMIITWSGPLTIKPVGYTPRPSMDNYKVEGWGERVILSEPRGVAVCSRFDFDNATQTGHLIAARGMPVWMAFAEGAEVVCRKVFLDRSVDWVDLEGPGKMIRRSEPSSLPLDEQARTAVDISADAADWISWQGSARVTIGRRTVRAADGAERTIQTVRDVLFRSGVRLARSEDQTSVECNQLRAWMAQDRNGRPFPQKCLAEGDVVARQGSSEIRCDELLMQFAQADSASGSSGVASSGNIIAKSLDAKGHVRLTDTSDDEQPVYATADHLTSDAIGRTATLLGSPAKITRGTSVLTGPRIDLNEKQQSVVVPAAGRLQFEMTRDLNSAQLSKPRPVTVTWKEHMTYSGLGNAAVLKGGVRLLSGGDEMRCGVLRLYFAETKQQVPSARADGSQGGTGIGFEQLSGRQINTMLAEDDVVLFSRRDDPQGKLLRRLKLTGDDVRIYPPQERLDVLGPGTLVVEDYRRPGQEGAPRSEDSALFGRRMQRPSQTALIWSDSMQLRQRELQAVLSGAVRLSHRAGRRVVLAERLNVDNWWSSLTEGRQTDLRCEKMMVRFDPPNGPGGQAVRGGEGPRLGPLRLFSAIGDVNLKDGDRQINQILGQRLIYDRARQIAVVHGYLQGQSPAPAVITYENRDTGQSQTWSGEDLTVYLRDGQIVRVVSGPVKTTGGG